MKIIEAIYGSGDCSLDVTERLQQQVRNGKIFLTVSNKLFTDPCPNKLKSLKIIYQLPGEAVSRHHQAQEGSILVLPVTNARSVGIFYTNLSVPEKYLNRVLQQLEKAAIDIDILTCSWRSIPGNPFPELSWPYHVSSHLTITLQILKLLYTAQEAGNYEYVFFLEHDVLYPEGYFAIEPFTEDVLVNTNFIGLSEEGFQAWRPHSQRPLHQLAMKLPAAIDHFMARMPRALTHGSIELEPYGRPWAERQSPEPAVHINHGKHFTSHFSIYAQDKFEKTHPYWGEATSWWE